MSIGFLFWLIMLLCLFFAFFQAWPRGPEGKFAYRPFGFNLVFFVLFFILGVKQFGWPIHG